MDKLKFKYEALASKAELISSQILEKEEEINLLIKEEKALKDTKKIFFDSIELVTKSFKKRTEDIITVVSKKVFQRDIKIKVNYDQKHYGLETNIAVMENGITLDPEDDMGGSIIEVISILLRIILLEYSNKKLRRTIILDEAFNWAGDLIILIGQIIKDFSKSIQFIIISHDSRLDDFADRIYKIERENLISKVVKIK